jgi:teichoic acid transport system permease protein
VAHHLADDPGRPAAGDLTMSVEPRQDGAAVPAPYDPRVRSEDEFDRPDARTPPSPDVDDLGTLPPGWSAELAKRYALRPSSARPGLRQYLRDVWARRHFLVAFSNARVVSMYSSARLGQLWQLLTPLLNAGVYLLLFGVLLNTSRGVDNFIAFLVIGVFIFNFTQRSVRHGADSVSGNLGLIRALHFPRATLPLAYALTELQQLFGALVVMAGAVLITGEPVTLRWLLVPAAVALQFVFNAGLGLAVARLVAQAPDLDRVLPFVLRTWLYMSGVFYSIPVFTRGAPDWIRVVLEINPAAVYIDLVRTALLVEHEPLPYAWPLAVGWALVAAVLGFVFFWRAETRYGRG